MKRLLLTSLILVAGCVGAGDRAADEATGQADEAVTAAATWQPLAHQPTFSIGAGLALLLTDGTVMVQDVGTRDWWKLTPDNRGSYVNGTWSQLASLPEGYSPLYFASAVLPDGRVIIEGGEYNEFNPVWGTQGAIYDPKLDQWTPIAPPAGWQTIGDAQSVVLANGQFMLADCCSYASAVLNPATLTWTEVGTGKADIHNEEGWTLLPNGTVLTVDANNTADLTHSEIYTPSTGKWTSAGSTIVQLADLDASGNGSHELGPQVLMPNGDVFVAGATGHTAIYHSRTGRWQAGPEFPLDADGNQLDVADGPATLLPNGHVLVSTSPTVFNAGVHFFDFDGTHLTETAAPPASPFNSSFNLNMLLLPTGQVLLTDFSNDVQIFTPVGAPSCGSRPEIEDSHSLDSLQRGQTYRISGEQLNGLSQAVAYGDDAQAATNYPLVRITNRASGHVFYARTHDHSTMSVAPGKHGSTWFDVPAGAETGKSDLVVVANGIASEPISVRIR